MLCYFGKKGLRAVLRICRLCSGGVCALVLLQLLVSLWAVHERNGLCPVHVEGRDLGRRAGWSVF